jgi:hypothetical protein
MPRAGLRSGPLRLCPQHVQKTYHVGMGVLGIGVRASAARKPAGSTRGTDGANRRLGREALRIWETELQKLQRDESAVTPSLACTAATSSRASGGWQCRRSRGSGTPDGGRSRYRVLCRAPAGSGSCDSRPRVARRRSRQRRDGLVPCLRHSPHARPPGYASAAGSGRSGSLG